MLTWITANWKTTVTGLAIFVLQTLPSIGVEILPAATIDTVTAVLVALGLLAAKDGDKH